MPVYPTFRDTEKVYSDEEDSRKSFSGAGEGRNVRSPEQFSPEELGADGSLPTCSHSNAYQLHSSNTSAGPPESGDSKASKRKRELNRRLLYNLYRVLVNNNEIKELLKEGADPNATCIDHGGNVYACHIAGFFKKDDLNNLEKTNALSHASENWTPLHVAAYFAQPETVRLLLIFQADPNICDDRGRTPLDVTGLVQATPNTIRCNLPHLSERNFIEVIELLIQAGGQQKTMIGDHFTRVQTPLHTAVELENQDAVQLLLRHGASVACWNQDGLTPAHLCIHREKRRRWLEEIFEILIGRGPDVVDSNEETVLRAAITHRWLEGVLRAVILEADITLMGKDGQTPFHIMAQDTAGWYEIVKPQNGYEIYKKDLRDALLDEIVRVAKINNAIDCLNDKGFTPLFTAVSSGKYLIAQRLLKEGASIKLTAVNGINILHVAAKHGQSLILKRLLQFDRDATKLMIYSQTNTEGYGPIHFAVAGNHLSCVQVFCENSIKGMDLVLRTDPKDTPLHEATAKDNVVIDTSIKNDIQKEKYEILHPKYTTPLHMAATNDNVDIATALIKACLQKKTICPLYEADENGWLPLHSAINNSSFNVIKYFVMDLNESLAELTRSKRPETALDMVIQHVANPTEFLKDFFDSCFSYCLTNKVEINYQILMPKRCVEEMDVVEALLKTGNEFDQKGLLLHPLIQSFIFLKWETMKPYYFLIASVYTLLLAWLLGFEISVFNDKDICNAKPDLVISIVGGCIIYLLTVLIILQELLMMNFESILKEFKDSQYLKQWRSWLKLGSLVSVFIVPPAITVSETAEWPRHVASLALFVVCFQMMNLLSQFPRWGYYVVMFKKVAFNVVKILASFSILLFCFAFSFKIQFRSEYPFNGPWDAIVKTLFMLSAEFEYNDVFESKNATKLGSSLEVVRIILLVFLILAAIVLMNMMVGVAVDDIKELTSQGHIGRLEKQAHFVRSLDRLKYNLWQSFLSCMTQDYQRRKFPPKIILSGDFLTQEPDYEYNIEVLPKRFKDAFYKIALKNKEKKDSQTSKDAQHETENSKNIFFDETSRRLDKLEKKINDMNEKVDNLMRFLQQSRVVR